MSQKRFPLSSAGQLIAAAIVDNARKGDEVMKTFQSRYDDECRAIQEEYRKKIDEATKGHQELLDVEITPFRDKHEELWAKIYEEIGVEKPSDEGGYEISDDYVFVQEAPKGGSCACGDPECPASLGGGALSMALLAALLAGGGGRPH